MVFVNEYNFLGNICWVELLEVINIEEDHDGVMELFWEGLKVSTLQYTNDDLTFLHSLHFLYFYNAIGCVNVSDHNMNNFIC